MRTPLYKTFTAVMSVFLVAAMLSVSTFAQKSGRISLEPVGRVSNENPSSPSLAPQPIFFPGQGNFSCTDVNASDDPLLAHVTTDWEWKFEPPQDTTLAPRTSGLGGGFPANPNMFMTFDLGPDTQMNFWQLSWTSPANLNALVSAVIIKGGNVGTNVYPYPTLATGDVGPFVLPNGAQAISHISFCFEPFTAPSAASAGVAGRVTTSIGSPISGATILVQNLNTGEVQYATTNSYGRYAMKGLPVGDFYALTVMHRRYIFDDATRTFTLESSLTDMDFMSR